MTIHQFVDAKLINSRQRKISTLTQCKNSIFIIDIRFAFLLIFFLRLIYLYTTDNIFCSASICIEANGTTTKNKVATPLTF